MFSIYLNDELIGECKSTKAAAKQWIQQYILSTHGGAWQRIDKGYLYLTSIGRTYEFKKTIGS